jgi:uncharacterized protein (TIGR02117 family)
MNAMDWGNARAAPRVAGYMAALLVLIVVGYGAAGLVGGAIPANAGWQPPADGIEIFVEDNGVHTGLVLPKHAAGIDLSALSQPQDLRDPRFAAYDHLAIGWGEHDFYLGTPTWADVSARTILRAAAGSDAVLLHIEHIPRPAPSQSVRRVLLRPAEYRRLVAFVRASLSSGGPRYPGYDRYDAFYTARGHYSAITTCNAWTGTALRSAGVRVGRWTPFPVTVMGWF